MARYELTLSNGEKVLVEHPADSIEKIMSAIEGKAFVQFAEVVVGTPAGRDALIATEHLALIRLLGFESQGSQFRPKR